MKSKTKFNIIIFTVLLITGFLIGVAIGNSTVSKKNATLESGPTVQELLDRIDGGQ